MSLVHRLGESVRNPGAHADHRRLLDAEPHCDRVRGLEADAADIAGETVGVLGHDLHGIGAVGLEDADRACGAHAMAMQEDHDLPHDILLGPGAGDALGPHGPMPVTSRRRSGSASITSNTFSPNALTIFLA